MDNKTFYTHVASQLEATNVRRESYDGYGGDEWRWVADDKDGKQIILSGEPGEDHIKEAFIKTIEALSKTQDELSFVRLRLRDPHDY